MWYSVKNIEAIDSPALLIYKERVQQNITKVMAMVNNLEQLRPHVKTHKIKEIIQMMQAEGISKFKCATIAEAEMLGLANTADVLIAYLITGPKIKRVQALREKFLVTNFACLIDNFETAQQLSQNFISNPLQVYIDLNVGMNRTGVSPENAFQLFKDCTDLKGIEITGLHAYDGHIHDSDVAIRTIKAKEVLNLILLVQNKIEEAFTKKLKIVVAGTPTFKIHAAQNKNAEVSPGTFVFWDEGYGSTMPDLDFSIAALIITRVISIIDKRTLCLDVGHKAIAAENPLPRIKFLNVENAKPIAQNEEHLIVEVADTSVHKVGDVWYGVPIHICPTVALYNEVMVVQDEKVVTKWKVIARDRMISV